MTHSFIPIASFRFHFLFFFNIINLDKVYDQNAKLLLHKRIHQQRFCPICNEHFTGRVDTHYMQRHHSTEPTHHCYICESACKNRNSMENHIKQIHSADEEEFYCDICKDTKNIGSKVAIEWHMKHRHNNEGKNVEHFQMEYVRVRKEQLQKQFSLDGGNEAAKLDCNQSGCDKELPIQSQSQSSNAKPQKKKKMKQCSVCLKFYINLSRHMNEKHDNPSGYVCDICGSTYARYLLLFFLSLSLFAFLFICNSVEFRFSFWYA